MTHLQADFVLCLAVTTGCEGAARAGGEPCLPCQLPQHPVGWVLAGWDQAKGTWQPSQKPPRCPLSLLRQPALNPSPHSSPAAALRAGTRGEV